MKYKIGDKVVIKSDIKTKTESLELLFAKEMNKYKGIEANVVSVCEDGYKLDVDDLRWWWVDEFFEDEPAGNDILLKITTMKNRLKELEKESNRIKNELISIKNTLNEI